MIVNDAVARRTIRLLREKKMTQYKLEKQSTITHGAMDRIINGKNKTVTLTTIYKLAKGFGMSIYQFLDDDIFRSKDLELD